MFLSDPHDDARAYWGEWSSLVGDSIHDCADDCCHLRLYRDFRAHLSLRCLDVRTKAWPGTTGETLAHEIIVLSLIQRLLHTSHPSRPPHNDPSLPTLFGF